MPTGNMELCHRFLTRLFDPVVGQEDSATFNYGNSLNLSCSFQVTRGERTPQLTRNAETPLGPFRRIRLNESRKLQN